MLSVCVRALEGFLFSRKQIKPQNDNNSNPTCALAVVSVDFVDLLDYCIYVRLLNCTTSFTFSLYALTLDEWCFSFV